MTRRYRPRRLAAGLLLAAAGAAVVLLTGAAPAGAAPPRPPTPTPTATASVAPAPPTPPAPGIQLGPGAPAGPLPTGTPGTAPPVDGGGSDSPGLFDIGGHIRAAIDGWFRDLVSSALDPLLSLLGRTVLATPDVTGLARISTLWAVSAGIANGAFVLLVLAGGAVVMGHETLQTRYSLREIAPRLVVGAVAANASLALAGVAIRVANAFSAAFLGQGLGPGNATSALRDLVLSPLNAGGIFLTLVGLVVAVLAVVLLATYVIRVALVVLLVAAAPLALALHALPQTEGLARLWWRAFCGCLMVQVGQSLVLIAALRVFFTPAGHGLLGLPSSGGLVDLLVAACLLWVLVRIPSWAARTVFAGTGHRPSGLARTVRYTLTYKAIRTGMAAIA